MNREYSKYSSKDPSGTRLIDELPYLTQDVLGYQEHMRQIGCHLVQAFEDDLQVNLTSGEICIVCTVEDADFLARGVIERLDYMGLGDRVRLLCLWNENIREPGIRLSPIVKQYKEAFEKKNPIFIIVKSIISGACVVKTNLSRALSQAEPTKIYVVSPVILEGAEKRLEREFPPSVSSKFQFVWFASDKEKIGDSVIPGIGGSVYELLGFKNSEDKNKYMPTIVKERRESFFGATPA
jgi:hypothetical protein